MKQWINPEMKELDVINTKGDTLDGSNPDGEYTWCGCPLHSDGEFHIPQ